MSACPKVWAAISASSFESSPRRTFFQRTLAHSAKRRSGATSGWSRRASARSQSGSGTTHLTAILASMTSRSPGRKVAFHRALCARASRTGMRAAGAHRTDLRSQLLERSSRLRCQRLPQDFAMLGFGRAAVLGGAQLEAGDELIIEIADDQLGHWASPWQRYHCYPCPPQTPVKPRRAFTINLSNSHYRLR